MEVALAVGMGVTGEKPTTMTHKPDSLVLRSCSKMRASGDGVRGCWGLVVLARGTTTLRGRSCSLELDGADIAWQGVRGGAEW